MSLKDLVSKNRSYRRYHEDVGVALDTLKELVDLARNSASGLNLQPLKYILSNEAKRNSLIFPQLGWARLIPNWAGPAEGERPTAYIVILGDTKISGNFGTDCGIAAQSILLGAVEKGLGGCMIATIRKKELAQALNVDPRYEILLVLSIGKPGETVKLEPLAKDGDTKYWRDEQGIHHVPKRALADIILI
ncbi:MAG: nitroreductase family protein [Dehalococcoidia bacterium]